MKKYPYSLIINKDVFNIGPDILRTIRRTTPEETSWYEKSFLADATKYGPKLTTYTLKKRWPQTKKDYKKIHLGRILELKNHTSILFHKESSWRIEFLDSKGNVVDRCKRNDKREAIIQKIQIFIEKAYPHYAKSNFADRIAATLMSGFSNVWLGFVDISKEYLKPLCSENEIPKFFWDGGRELFFYDEELPYYTHQDSGLCFISSKVYSIDIEPFINDGEGNWLWLHRHIHDKRLHLRLLPKFKSEILSQLGALEIVFKAPLTESEMDHCWVD